MATFLLLLALLAILIFASIPSIVAFLVGAPFVPTPMRAVKKMLKISGIKKGQKIYDIGCGDGRIVHHASKHYGADAVGYELSPPVYVMAKLRGLFLKSKAKIVFGDFRKQNISDADFILCYMLPRTMKNFRKKFEKEMKKGAKIISYAFNIHDWKPIHKEERDAKTRTAPIWVYEIGKHKE
jgi:cyclopropane fatty-acyl-phospholipid synthase-like methyltransferase